MNTKDLVFGLRTLQIGALTAALLGAFLFNPYLWHKGRPIHPTEFVGALLLSAGLIAFSLATIGRIAVCWQGVVRRRRLARECARLDPHAEQALAEDGLACDRPTTPRVPG
jgi:hypothetical protein